jgi:hypothetical protein
MFFEKKGLCPLGVRPWIRMFLIFKKIYKIVQMDHDALNVLTIVVF